MIWTVVAASDSNGGSMKAYRDWRPVAEFYSSASAGADTRCELAAKQLGLKPDAYRCVQTK
jgi:hypothetical protein